jgi:hypothetical protein
MAIALDTRRVFANLKHLKFTPWKSEGELGSDSFDLIDIVGDTTSLEQADNEVNELAHEFQTEPLYENVTLGKKTFTTECIDLQNEVLAQLFGWTVDDTNKIAFAPTAYKDLYCQIEMGFNSTNDVVVLPKVKLNSRAVFASLKTDASRANITGTCYSAYVKASSGNAQDTDMAIIGADTNGSVTYTVSATKPKA